VAIVVERAGGRILLQRRSTSDGWHPGLWTLSSTGHVRAGERYADAARRELGEELGLSARVRPVGKFLLPKIQSRGLTEWEYVTLFVCKTDAKAKIDPSELAGVADFNFRNAKKMIRGSRLTPDAKILLREYLSAGGHLTRKSPAGGASIH